MGPLTLVTESFRYSVNAVSCAAMPEELIIKMEMSAGNLGCYCTNNHSESAGS